MSRYDPTEDPLCYPSTNVLRNKANLRSQEQLDQFELLMFLTRSEEPLHKGELDYSHYQAIHHHFFQDVYSIDASHIRAEVPARPTGQGGLISTPLRWKAHTGVTKILMRLPKLPRSGKKAMEG